MTHLLDRPASRRHALTHHGRIGVELTLVLAHGFGCDQGMWDLVLPALAAEHQVLTFDHVGAGLSDTSSYDPGRHGSVAGYVEDLLELLEEVDAGPVVLVGHSVSAMIGVVACSLRPELFAGLVMVAPSPRYIDDEGYRGGFSEQDVHDLLETLEANYLGWSAAMAPVVMGNGERPDLAARLERSFCRTDPEIAAQFARVTFLSDHRADLPHVRVPTLVLQCRDDVIAPESVGEYVVSQLPDGQYQLLDAVGHCPHVSAPRETAEAVLSFLRRLPA